MRDFSPLRFLRSPWLVGLGVAAVVAIAFYWLQLPEKNVGSASSRIEKLLKEHRRQSSAHSNPDWVQSLTWKLKRWLRFREPINTFGELAALDTNTIPRLTEALSRDSDPEVRDLAADVLGELREPRLVDTFTNALSHESDGRVLASISRALLELRATNAVPLLVASLASQTNSDIKEYTVMTLGLFSGPLARQTLLSLLQGTNDPLRKAAISALGDTADPTVVTNLAVVLHGTPSKDTMEAVLASLGRLNTPEAAAIIVAQVRTNSASQMRSAAAEALTRKITPDLVPQLRAALAAEQDPSVRRAIIDAMGWTDSPDVLRLLRTAATSDPDLDNRETAIRALTSFMSNRSVAELTTAAHEDPLAEVREAAAIELVDAGEEEVVPLLLRVLKESQSVFLARALCVRGVRDVEPIMTNWLASTAGSEPSRSQTLQSLAITENPEFLGLFISNLTNNSAEMRTAAANALASYPCDATARALAGVLEKETNNGVLAASLSTLATFKNPEAVAPILRIIRTHPTGYLRAPAYEALGNMPGAAALPTLASAARRERSTETRHAAIHALGVHGGSEANTTLARCLARCDAWDIPERVAIIEACGVCGEPANAPLLIPLLDEPDQRIATAAAEALGTMGVTNAVAGLARLATAGGRTARASAAVALGEIGDSKALPVLFELLAHDRDSTVRTKAAEALGIISDASAVSQLQLYLSDPAEEVQTEVVCSLGHLGDTNCVDDIIGLLTNQPANVQFAASYFLVEIGGARGAEALLENLGNRDPDSRLASACALAAMGRTNGIPVFRALMHHSEPWCRVASVVSLAQLRCPEAMELLKLKTTDRAPAIARIAHAGLAGNFTDALAAAASDKDVRIRRAVAFAFLFINDPAAIPALRNACHDRDAKTRTAARWVARRMERMTAASPHPIAGKN
jgi:HEAT repeat protein